MADAVQSQNLLARKPITAERLRELFSYDPDTGIVRRRKTVGGRWLAGTVVGGVFDGQGHLGTSVDGHRLYLHVAIWVIVTGEWPTGDLDHKDTNPSNNRWSNLRQATRSQNLMNRLDSKNKSGVKGVHFDRERKLWCAEIKAGAVRRRLGRFKTLDEATKAYERAALELHGEFARFVPPVSGY